jgi:ankyrin repeat protein
MKTRINVLLTIYLVSAISGCATDGNNPDKLNDVAAVPDSDILTLARENRGSEINSLFPEDLQLNRTDEDGRTALHWAVINKDTKTAETLLKQGADPDLTDRFGMAPLHLAIMNRDPAIGRLLVENGADVLLETPMGENALTMAFQRDLTLLEFLVNRDNVNTDLPNGESVLHLSVRKGNKPFTVYLLGLGANPNKLDLQGLLPLDVALSFDDLEHMQIAALLVENDSYGTSNKDKEYFFRILLSDSIMTRFDYGKTGFHLAAERNHLGILEYLNQIGSGDVNIQDNSGNTALHLAAMNGNAGAVEILINAGAELNRINYFGNTPLHEAVKVDNNGSMVSQLILSGADINAKNNFGNTPLHIVSGQTSDPTLIRILLDNKADINSRNKTGNTALMESMEKLNRDAAMALISFNADIFALNNRGINPVQLAINGGVPVISWFFTEKSINQSDNVGDTPLHTAIRMKADPAIIKILLEKGSDPNKRNSSGDTPFHLATAGRLINFTDLIFAFNGDATLKNNKGESPLLMAIRSDLDFFNRFLPDNWVNKPDKDGETPLFYAINDNSLGASELLVKTRKADVEWKNNRGQTPLFIAITGERIPILKMLIKAGANINSRDSYGNTPFFYVSQLTNPIEVGDLLLASGADLKIKNNEGRTILHETVLSGNSFFLKYLLDRGADINSIDNQGKTPLFLAVAEDFRDIVQFLVGRGAYLEYRDQDGNTVLHDAILFSRYDLAQYLIKSGSDVYAVNKRGKTPMDLILFSPLAVADSFFSPANINRFDNQGNSPLHFAVSRKAPLEIIKMIIGKGGDIYARNSSGKRAVDLAREINYTESFSLLEPSTSK